MSSLSLSNNVNSKNTINNKKPEMTSLIEKSDSKIPKIFGDYKLFAEIASFKMGSDNETVYYNIKLKSAITGEEWELNRRYSDFYEYYSVLIKSFYDIPSLPRKTLTKVTSLPEIEERKDQLNSFIRVILPIIY